MRSGIISGRNLKYDACLTCCHQNSAILYLMLFVYFCSCAIKKKARKQKTKKQKTCNLHAAKSIVDTMPKCIVCLNCNDDCLEKC